MKKTIAILLVLVLAGVGLFAANTGSADLTLNTAVTGRFEIKIAIEGVAAGGSTGERRAAFEAITDLTTAVAFDAEATTQVMSHTLNVSYLTNQKGTSTVSATVQPMASADTAQKIGYDVTVGTTVYEVGKADANVTIPFIVEASEINGMRIESQEFTIAMRENEWDDASAADDYTTTWTIALVTV